MLENLHSGHTALSEAEIEHLGVDPDDVLSVEVEDYHRVAILFKGAVN